MNKARIYLLTFGTSPQINFLKDVCDEYSLESKVIDFYDFNNSITITSRGILLNNELIKAPSIFYQIGINADYLTVPESNIFSYNFSNFNDNQLILEQLKSQALSLINFAKNQKGFFVINNPTDIFNLSSKLLQFKLFDSMGIKHPDFILTTSLKEINKIYSLTNSEYLLWSYPHNNTPIKSLKKKNITRLISTSNEMPVIFFETIIGKQVKIWFFNNIPMLSCIIENPYYNIDSTAMLEKYYFFEPGSSFFELGNNLNTKFSGFYEIRAIINEQNELFVYNLDLSPDFMILGELGKNFLARELIISMQKLAGYNLVNNKPLPKAESRDTIFLNRMYESLFAIEESN